jgi:hypothetical protein
VEGLVEPVPLAIVIELKRNLWPLSLLFIPSKQPSNSMKSLCVAWHGHFETQRDRFPVDDEAPGSGRRKVSAR